MEIQNINTNIQQENKHAIPGKGARKERRKIRYDRRRAEIDGFVVRFSFQKERRSGHDRRQRYSPESA